MKNDRKEKQQDASLKPVSDSVANNLKFGAKLKTCEEMLKKNAQQG